jgi:hypothetical protein
MKLIDESFAVNCDATTIPWVGPLVGGHNRDWAFNPWVEPRRTELLRVSSGNQGSTTKNEIMGFRHGPD